MKSTTSSSRIITGFALMGCLSLLLADSAEPYCSASEGRFDRTFDYTSTCNGTHSGRFRIAVESFGPSAVSGSSLELPNGSVTLVSGQLPPAQIKLLGNCADEDEPTVANGIQMSFSKDLASSTSSSSSSSSTSGGGGGGAGGAGGNAGAGGAPVPPAIVDAQCSFNFMALSDKKPIECFSSADFDRVTPLCTLQLSDAK